MRENATSSNSSLANRIVFCGASVMFLIVLLTCLVCPVQAYAASEGRADAQRVLFVGNSFVHLKNDGIVEQLKPLVKANGKELTVRRVSYSGAFLANYATATDGKKYRYKAFEKKLKSGTWDYIVLQDHTKSTLMNPVKMYCSFRLLINRIKQVQPGAQIFLYMTPAYQVKEIKTQDGSVSLNESKFQSYVQAYYKYLGDKLNVQVVPVGMYFSKAASATNGIRVVGSDGIHPNHAGYFLAACAFYKAIFGSTPSEVSTYKNAPSELTQRKLFSVTRATLFLSRNRATMQAGEALKLKALSTKGEIKYKSLNPGIATITSKGKVKAKKPGAATIVAENGNGEKATCYISVESDSLQEKKITFKKAQCYVAAGKQAYNAPTVSEVVGNYDLVWESSDKSIAKVNELGVVTGVSKGSATVTATDSESGYAAEYTVRVKDGVQAAKKTAKLAKPRLKAKIVKSRVRLKWSKVNSSNGYLVYRAKAGTKSFKLVAKIFKRSRTKMSDAKVKQGKTYVYKIRSYKIVQGKAVYGPYSKPARIKVKKETVNDLNAAGIASK